jgi:hypothetical protein
MDITARGPVGNPNSSRFLTLNDGKFKIVAAECPCPKRYVGRASRNKGSYGHRASLGYYITPHLELETSASTTQGNQITLEWSKEY